MNANILGWLALATIAVSFGLWGRAIRKVSIPENRSPFVIAWLGGATLGLLALTGGADLIGRIPAWIALGTGLILCFTILIGTQKVGPDAIRTGDTMPAFTAVDENGEPFDSHSLSGNFVLIKFYRGHW